MSKFKEHKMKYLIILFSVFIILLLLYIAFGKIYVKCGDSPSSPTPQNSMYANLDSTDNSSSKLIYTTKNDINFITGSYYDYQIVGNSMFTMSVFASGTPTLLTHDSKNIFLRNDETWYLLNKDCYNGSIVYDLYSSKNKMNKSNKKISILVDMADNNLIKQYTYLTASSYRVSIKNTITSYKTTDKESQYDVLYMGQDKSILVQTNSPDNGCNNDIIMRMIYDNKPKTLQPESDYMYNCVMDQKECALIGYNPGCYNPECQKAVKKHCCSGSDSERERCLHGLCKDLN